MGFIHNGTETGMVTGPKLLCLQVYPGVFTIEAMLFKEVVASCIQLSTTPILKLSDI
jgi:hypothetical protein